MRLLSGRNGRVFRLISMRLVGVLVFNFLRFGMCMVCFLFVVVVVNIFIVCGYC